LQVVSAETRLFERRAGSGLPLVFVHGLGVSSRYFVPALRELARDFDCRAPDLPGYGKSPKPRDALDVPELAHVLLEWMPQHAPLLANSFGCQIAVEAAVAAPERVPALVLVGPTYDPRASLTRTLARLALDALREPPALLAAESLDYARMGPRRVVQTAAIMRDHPLQTRLPLVTQPTLVVRGARDAIVPQRWAERVTALVPRARLETVPGAAHAVHWSHPRELRALVLDFLQESE
jgi:pimeloyl-ACP methyl ester carboxylesterase